VAQQKQLLGNMGSTFVGDALGRFMAFLASKNLRFIGADWK